MNDSLIDKILLAGAVVAVLAAAAFFGIRGIDWAPSTVATTDGTATPALPDVTAGTPLPTPAEGTVLPTPEGDGALVPTTEGDISSDDAEQPADPAPTATPIGKRPRINTDYLLLTPASSEDEIPLEEAEEVPTATMEYVEPTQEVWATEVIPPPESIEPTLPADPKEDPDDSYAEPTPTLDPYRDGATETPGIIATEQVIVDAPADPTVVPTATVPPMDVIRGSVTWSGLRAVTKDMLIPAGSQLIVEPNTTIKMSAGVSIYVDGTFRLNGTKAQPVYLTGANESAQPWGGVYVREDGVMTVNDSVITNGGAAGTLVSVEIGTLRIADSELKNNRGHIRLTDAVFSLQKSTLRDNDVAFGAMIDTTYTANGSILVEASRIGPNSGGSGTQIAVDQTGALSQLQFDMTGANLVGTSGTNVVLLNGGTMTGAVQCTTFHGGDTALRIDSAGPSVPGIGLTVRQSVFSGHRIVYGPPRVVVSNVGLDARTNWWNAATGPYHPKTNPAGTGEANGVNVSAGGWLTARPACAPTP
jgi:hypothetical protein